MKTHSGRKLSRPTGARIALLRNLATSLLKHEQVQTTFAKAKEVSRYAEGIIATAKRKDLPSLRRVAVDITDKEVAKKIHEVLVPRYAERAGGCTRVLRTGRRLGDNAEMAVVKLVS